MSSNESFTYLMHVCDSIRGKHIELNNLYAYYLKFGISREFLLKEMNFYNQIIISFLTRLREVLPEDDMRNFTQIEYLLHKLFSHSVCSGESLTREELHKLETRLKTFTKEFHANFIKTLKLYDVEAELPPESKEEDIKYFCGMRLALLDNTPPYLLMGREIPLTILSSMLLKLSGDKDSPVNTLIKGDKETLLSNEELPDTLKLINSIFSS
jgi:hypothetical protein